MSLITTVTIIEFNTCSQYDVFALAVVHGSESDEVFLDTIFQHTPLLRLLLYFLV